MIDELLAGGFSLDLSSSEPFPIDLSIADFREPEKRSRNLSKEIKLPGTAKNRQFFQNNFNLTGIGGTSARVPCDYRKDGISVLPNGVLKLNSVTDDGVLTFNITIFSDFVDIFLTLAQKQVKELNWSDLNHNLTVAAIQASWTTPNGQGYYYPLIVRRPKISATAWDTTDMIPYVFMVDVFRRCMASVGQSYSSTFLSSATARRIVYGYGGGTFVDTALTPSELALRSAVTQPQNITQSVGVVAPDSYRIAPQQVVPATVISDPGGLFNGSSFTVNQAGNYSFDVVGSCSCVASYMVPFSSFSPSLLTFDVRKNGNFIKRVIIDTPTVSTTANIADSTSLSLVSGDVVTLELEGVFIDSNPLTFTRSITFASGFIARLRSADTAIVNGSAIEVQRFLPQQSCAEFVLGVIRAFNLYVSAPNAQGVISIEPQKDFYKPTNQFKDISAKVDLSKPIEIRPSAIEFAKRLTYSFKQAPESDARSHAAKWLQEYGSYSFEQANHYAKGEQKIELPFATCLPYQVAPNIIAPRFCKVENAVITAVDGPPRLMFKQGLKTGSWSLRGTNFTTYPGVHHFDNWQNPQNDLNFGLTPELYHIANIVTLRNIYANYYEKQVKQVIDPDGKVVQMYVELDPLEVSKIDFSLNIMYDGALFTLNRVFDFDSNFSATTKIELLKVGEAYSRPLGQVTKVAALAATVIKSPTSSSAVGVGVISAGRNTALATSKVTRIG